MTRMNRITSELVDTLQLWKLLDTYRDDCGAQYESGLSDSGSSVAYFALFSLHRILLSCLLY